MAISANRSRWAALAALSWAALAPASARAQDPADFPPPQGDQPTVVRGIDMLERRSYWESSAEARVFASAVLEAGVVYYRPNIAIGYGKPHWSWLGVEGYSGVSTSGGAEYIGVRAVLPVVEVRAGTRYVFPVDRYCLPPQEMYTRDDTEIIVGPRSTYISAEIELAGSIAVPGGSLFGVATGFAVLGVPDGFYIYEEALHTVIEPPLLWRTRLGYLADVDRFGELRVGAAVELLGNPGRGAVFVRAGPVLSLSLTHHLDAAFAAMIVAASPDSLGLLGADLGQLGLRYKWATGDRWPEFP